MFILLAAAAALGVAATSPPSSMPQTLPGVGKLDRVVQTYSLADVAAVAKGLGLATEEGPASATDQYLVIKLDQGAIFATPHCMKDNPSRCPGLEFQAIYAEKNVPLEIINQFNDDHVFSQAYVHGGRVMLSRYDAADYGTPIGNVAMDMAVFIDLAVQFTKVLADSGASASLKAPGPSALPQSAQAFGQAAAGRTMPVDHTDLPAIAVNYALGAAK